MKKCLTLCLCLAALLCLIFLATPKANAATYGDLTYTVSSDKVTITDCNTSATGDITIPSTLDGYPVTAIGNAAFAGCTSLTSVTIPDSVTTIGDLAFYNCTRLSGVTIPDSVTTIGYSAFAECYGLTSVTIGDSVTTIGKNAFSYCDSLTSVTIGDSVTTIGDSAFENCTGLTGITIPDSVTTIGKYAFNKCKSLTSITIPDSVTTISNYAFWYCTSLTSITVPDSVTTIGSYVFCDCTSLTSITIPDSVTTIGNYAFSDCTSLTSVTIPDSVTSIGSGAFAGCSNLESMTIPFVGGSRKTAADTYQYPFGYIFGSSSYTGGVVTEQNYYGSNTSYTTANIYYIPASLKSVTVTGGDILRGAFEDCKSLTSITIPDSVTTIGNYAFSDCYLLTSITIPDSVTTIGNYAFSDCTSLRDVYYTGTQTQWNGISIASGNTALTGATIHCSWHDHVFTNYVSNNDATCTADGTKTAKCDRCDVTDTAADTGSALGHSFTDYISNGDATYEADGTKTAKCDRCDATDTVADPGSKIPMPESAIIKQPESITVESGETVQFHIEAHGDVVSYKWEYARIYKFFNTYMAGYNTDTLTVPAIGSRNNYSYRCVVTFADGTVLVSDTAKLYVNTFIEVTDDPNDQTVVLGYKGQFTVKAEGEGLKYQWEYKRPNGERWEETSMEGATNETVMILTETSRDGYAYRCKITDVTGQVTYSGVAIMRVLSFTSHPVETFAATGDTVTFTVATSVAEGFTYQWQYRRSATGSWSDTGLEGNKTATLTVPAKGKNGYEYRCVLTGSKNSKIESKAAVLHVGEPVVITAQPQSVTVSSADNAVFTVEATNVYSYQWMYSKNGTNWYTTTAEGNKTATLTASAKGRNGYQYRCDMKGLDDRIYSTEVVSITIG